MTIGSRIKQRRIELGWTLREFADRMGYANHSTVARIERGEIDIAQSKIARFSEVLGVSVSYLMGWEEEQKKNDILADIVVRMRTDDEFRSVIESLYMLDSEKLKGFKSMLSAFLK